MDWGTQDIIVSAFAMGAAVVLCWRIGRLFVPSRSAECTACSSCPSSSTRPVAGPRPSSQEVVQMVPLGSLKKRRPSPVHH
jgi:hypothetical protein